MDGCHNGVPTSRVRMNYATRWNGNGLLWSIWVGITDDNLFSCIRRGNGKRQRSHATTQTQKCIWTNGDTKKQRESLGWDEGRILVEILNPVEEADDVWWFLRFLLCSQGSSLIRDLRFSTLPMFMVLCIAVDGPKNKQG